MLIKICSIALQVWSQASSPQNVTSSDIVMKTQSWMENSDSAKVVLVNSEDKVSVLYRLQQPIHLYR